MRKLLVLSVLTLTACTDNASFDTVESSRKQANENSIYNANMYRATRSDWEGWSISTASDSTQSAKCPQGDGWATLALSNPKTGGKVPLKCSTVSEGLGCLLDSEFKQKPALAAQDSNCDDSIPMPLPKIQK